ncbi:NAD(P)(+) transhydrogenase (Re/Si-specific) subunit beta [Granulosicoccus antarcticus]|nr:NAD(P)(+) transhydrogenase (Re/Si-specific) subunit beta [Granulosicoccus antarcticus]
MPISLQLVWFIATVLFVIGLRRLSSPTRARTGIWFAGLGMLLAIISMFLHPELGRNHVLILLAMALGGGIAFLHARKVDMTNIPQMVALYNGLGGAAAASIGMLVLLHVSDYGPGVKALAVVSGLIGWISFSGSIFAFLRLSGYFSRREGFAKRQVAYLASGALVLLLGLILATSATAHPVLLLLFALLAVSFGLLMTLPTSAADMPVLISFYNALTGLAVALDGFVLDNPAMVIAGTIVFAAGSLLTRLMARSVNRRLSEIMYSGFGIQVDTPTSTHGRDHVNTTDARDAAVDMAYANRVMIVPGYGMATAQAQHKIRELTQLLDERGVQTEFAIHPVAGRMPGHMNVLLAEAGVPYEKISDLNAINSEFSQIDVVLVVGANDIVNPAARDDSESPLFGMPVLNVDHAARVIVLKRGDGTGYAGVENALLFAPVTRVLFGDARDSVQELIMAIKGLD